MSRDRKGGAEAPHSKLIEVDGWFGLGSNSRDLGSSQGLTVGGISSTQKKRGDVRGTGSGIESLLCKSCE
jgi:hypothetical protein